MTFRQFIEQGTGFGTLNAAGRAGQKQYTPEVGVKKAPVMKPLKKPKKPILFQF